MLWRNGDYELTDDPAAVDLDAVHGFLRQSYGAGGIPRETVARSLAHSLCFSLRLHGRQAGFCRAITDRATFAYLADVFVLPEHRGQGLGKWLVARVLEHPELQGLRRFLLATMDAGGLYARYGFAPLGRPDIFLEILGAPYTAEARKP